MSKIIIEGNPTSLRAIPEGNYLNVAEFFCDTIQGEGINLGEPAAFLRLQSCTMACIWCDTQEVWRFGNPYSFDELFDLMAEADLPRKLKEGQHLVLTGGSPLLQQTQLSRFLSRLIVRYGFKPIIEIENECTLMPNETMVELVNCWNNSPKLKGSGNADFIRYNTKILSYLSSLENAWFKFVVSGESDWTQIQNDFLNTQVIKKEQVILMPQGATREELFANREIVLEMAVRHSVRYTTREHIVLWDKKTGV